MVTDSSTSTIKIHPIPKGKNRLDIPVSLVKGSKNNRILGKSDLRTVLNGIVDKENTALVRFTESLHQSKGKYSELKNKSCEGFIIGQFAPTREDANCQIYVPLLGFDIDGIEDEFYTDLTLSECRKVPNIFLAYPSPSRKGLRIFIWCDSNPKTHKTVYESVCNMLAESLRLKTDKTVRKEIKAKGIKDSKEVNKLLKESEHIDTSTKNISRLWFYTHLSKESIYLNLDSTVFKSSSPTPSKLDHKRPLNTNTQDKTLDQAERVRICLKMASERNILTGRNNGLYSLACLMVEHGVNQSEILKYCLSLEETDFTEPEIIKTVNSALKRATPNKFSDAQILAYIGKLEGKILKPIKIVQEQDKANKKDDFLLLENSRPLKEFEIIDWEDKAIIEDLFGNKNLSTYLKIKAYLLSKYEFRKNVISNDVEYRLRDSTDPFIDLNEFDMVCEILDYGLKASVDKQLKSLLKSDYYVPRFNPIKFYFRHLPEWKETDPDHIDNLANFVIAKDQEWFNYQFKKMIVRTAACVLNFVPFNKQCFTLLGGQNDGKTSFLRFLCPKELKNYYKENIDITTKDGKIALCQNMFINFEELDALNKKELNKIKAMFTVDKVKVRPPYGHRDLNYPRTCNFLASSNRQEILTDETGNIRWLVFEILSINHDNGGKDGYNQNINIDLVWAQAFQLLKNGFKFNLTRLDLDKSEKNNKSYQQITVEMEWIQKLFTSSNNLEPNSKFLMASDILKAIQEHSLHNRINITNVGKGLRFLNFDRSQYRTGKEKTPRYGYWVKLNSMDE